MKCAQKISIRSRKRKAQPAVCTSLPFWYFRRLSWWMCVHYVSIGSRKYSLQQAVCPSLLFQWFQRVSSSNVCALREHRVTAVLRLASCVRIPYVLMLSNALKSILLQPSYQCRQLPVLLIHNLMIRNVDAEFDHCHSRMFGCSRHVTQDCCMCFSWIIWLGHQAKILCTWLLCRVKALRLSAEKRKSKL